MTRSEDTEIDLQFDGETVTARIPEDAALTGESAEEVFDQFRRNIRRADSALTIIESDNPIDSGAFDIVENASELAEKHGVEKRAIVTGEMVKGLAFSSRLDFGGDVEVFDTEQEAHEFLN